MSDHRPPVSARGVLDGDPTALAGLCDLRGPGVVAYCHAVCGPAAAVDAAAAAFAAFRATAAGATHPLAINPESLLLAKAREAAAAHAPDPSGGSPRPDDPLCPEVPRLLAGAAQGALLPAERHHLRRHLARCVPCRAAQNAQREAERAYAHPPSPALAPITRQAVIAALRNAIPPTGPSPARPTHATPDPSGAARAPGPGPGPADADTPTRLPMIAVRSRAQGTAATPSRPPPESDPGPARVPPTPPTPPPAPRPAMPVPGSHVSRSPGPTAEAATGVIPVDRVAAALGYAEPPADPPPSADPAPAPPRLALARLAGAAIARLPRARVLAPVGVLVAALLVVLAIAGVFSGGTHSPTPAPASSAAPPATRPPALDRSPAAHRARLRAAARRRAARARAARAKRRAAAPPAAGSTTATTPGGPSTAAGAPATPPPAAGAPSTRVLAAPAATAPPVNGAAPAPSGGFHAD